MSAVPPLLADLVPAHADPIPPVTCQLPLPQRRTPQLSYRENRTCRSFIPQRQYLSKLSKLIRSKCDPYRDVFLRLKLNLTVAEAVEPRARNVAMVVSQIELGRASTATGSPRRADRARIGPEDGSGTPEGGRDRRRHQRRPAAATREPVNENEDDGYAAASSSAERRFIRSGALLPLDPGLLLSLASARRLDERGSGRPAPRHAPGAGSRFFAVRLRWLPSS